MVAPAVRVVPGMGVQDLGDAVRTSLGRVSVSTTAPSAAPWVVPAAGGIPEQKDAAMGAALVRIVLGNCIGDVSAAAAGATRVVVAAAPAPLVAQAAVEPVVPRLGEEVLSTPRMTLAPMTPVTTWQTTSDKAADEYIPAPVTVITPGANRVSPVAAAIALETPVAADTTILAEATTDTPIAPVRPVLQDTDIDYEVHDINADAHALPIEGSRVSPVAAFASAAEAAVEKTVDIVQETAAAIVTGGYNIMDSIGASIGFGEGPAAIETNAHEPADETVASVDDVVETLRSAPDQIPHEPEVITAEPVMVFSDDVYPTYGETGYDPTYGDTGYDRSDAMMDSSLNSEIKHEFQTSDPWPQLGEPAGLNAADDFERPVVLEQTDHVAVFPVSADEAIEVHNNSMVEAVEVETIEVVPAGESLVGLTGLVGDATEEIYDATQEVAVVESSDWRVKETARIDDDAPVTLAEAVSRLAFLEEKVVDDHTAHLELAPDSAKEDIAGKDSSSQAECEVEAVEAHHEESGPNSGYFGFVETAVSAAVAMVEEVGTAASAAVGMAEEAIHDAFVHSPEKAMQEPGVTMVASDEPSMVAESTLSSPERTATLLDAAAVETAADHEAPGLSAEPTDRVPRLDLEAVVDMAMEAAHDQLAPAPFAEAETYDTAVVEVTETAEGRVTEATFEHVEVTESAEGRVTEAILEHVEITESADGQRTDVILERVEIEHGISDLAAAPFAVGASTAMEDVIEAVSQLAPAPALEASSIPLSARASSAGEAAGEQSTVEETHWQSCEPADEDPSARARGGSGESHEASIISDEGSAHGATACTADSSVETGEFGAAVPATSSVKELSVKEESEPTEGGEVRESATTRGAKAGLLAGGAVGAALGVVPALFTFGLSIPITAAVVGGMGSVMGAAGGGAVSLLKGETERSEPDAE